MTRKNTSTVIDNDWLTISTGGLRRPELGPRSAAPGQGTGPELTGRRAGR